MRGAQCKLDLNYSCRSFPKISYGNHVMGLRRRLRAGRSSASNVSDIQLSGSGRDSNLFDDEATIVDSRNTPLRPFELERYFSLVRIITFKKLWISNFHISNALY